MDQLCALCFCHADNQDDHRRESAASKAPDCSNCEILAKVRREIQAKNINVTEHKFAQIWNLQHTKALLFLLTSHVTLHMSLNLNVSTKLNTSLKYVLICQAVWSSRSIMGIIMIMTIIRRRKKCAYMPVWSSPTVWPTDGKEVSQRRITLQSNTLFISTEGKNLPTHYKHPGRNLKRKGK